MRKTILLSPNSKSTSFKRINSAEHGGALISASGKKRQKDLCKFEVSLVCTVNSKTARALYRDFVSKTKLGVVAHTLVPVLRRQRQEGVFL